MKVNLITKLAGAVGIFGWLHLSAYAQDYNLIMTAAEDPGATNSTLADTTVETFNELSVGDHTNVVTSIGTYNLLSILAANEYGGAAGPGYPDGSPYAVTSTSSGLGGIPTTTLTFSNPIAYFGLWWSAGDAANVLTFYNGTTEVGQFTTASLVNLLPSSYKGNTTPGYIGADYGEKFAFINFYGVDGTAFTSVQFSNIGSSGFENDNNTIRTAAYGSDTNDTSSTLPGLPIEEVINNGGTQTVITNSTTIVGNEVGTPAPAPEPSSFALLGVAGAAGLVWAARRRTVKA